VDVSSSARKRGREKDEVTRYEAGNPWGKKKGGGTPGLRRGPTLKSGGKKKKWAIFVRASRPEVALFGVRLQGRGGRSWSSSICCIWGKKGRENEFRRFKKKKEAVLSILKRTQDEHHPGFGE